MELLLLAILITLLGAWPIIGWIALVLAGIIIFILVFKKTLSLLGDFFDLISGPVHRLDGWIHNHRLIILALIIAAAMIIGAIYSA